MDPNEDLEKGQQPSQVHAAEPAPDENRSGVNQTTQCPTTDAAGSNNSSGQRDAEVVSIESAKVCVLDLIRAKSGKRNYHQVLHREIDDFQKSLRNAGTEQHLDADESQQVLLVARAEVPRECIEEYLCKRQTPQDLIEGFLKRSFDFALRRPIGEQHPDSCFHADWMQLDNTVSVLVERGKPLDGMDDYARDIGSHRVLLFTTRESDGSISTNCEAAHKGDVDCLLTPRTILVMIDGYEHFESIINHLIIDSKTSRTSSATTRCLLLRMEICRTILRAEVEILGHVEEMLYEINFDIGDEALYWKMPFLQYSLGVYRAHLHSRCKLRRQITRTIKSANQEDENEEEMKESVRSLQEGLDGYSAQLDDVLRHLESTSSAVTGSMSIRESGKAIKQAEEVTKLTQLAFFFIPLTFVAGIFGMNLKEMANISIWIWVVTSVILLLASYLTLYFTEVRGFILNWQEKWRMKWIFFRASPPEFITVDFNGSET